MNAVKETNVSTNNKTISGLEEELIRCGFDTYPEDFSERIASVTGTDVERELSKPFKPFSIDRLMTLISPAALPYLEKMAQLSREITLQRFGRTMVLYAPVYVSNHCVNRCRYCGFNHKHEIARKRLSIEEAEAEAEWLYKEGYRDILLVSGEDKTFVDVDYMSELTRRLRRKFASVALEIYPMDEESYRKMVEAGADGVTLYQETYDRELYKKFHEAGPKANYSNRLTAQEAYAKAGMRRFGIGALLGLGDWRYEAVALGIHARYLMKNYWRGRIGISFCRMRPAAEVDLSELQIMSDPEHVQMITAMRLCFSDAALVLSTRESAEYRNNLIRLGITQISAGSRTNPGGYNDDEATGQFDVNDSRSPAEVARLLDENGFEPVWKDWDSFDIKG